MCFVNKPSTPPPPVIPPPPPPPDISEQVSPVLAGLSPKTARKPIGLSQLRKDLTISPVYSGGSGLNIPT